MTQLVCMPGNPVAEVQNSTYRNPADWFVEAITAGSSDSGVAVNASTVLTHGPVWQAVNVLAGDVGQLPLHVMRRVDDRTTTKDRTHPASRLLRHSPNGWQLASVWKETMMSWALIWGNAISEIVRDGQGRPLELIPWLPDRTTYDVIDGEILYVTRTLDHKIRIARRSDVFHITGLSRDGYWGYSLVEVAKQVIGHGLALQKHGNVTFKNSARPSGVLEHPGRLDDDARKNLRGEWNAIHGGPENANKIAVLWEGMKFSPMSMSNEDAQWLEARRLDREFVASLFNLPAFKLNSMENSSVRANLEEQNRDYFQTSLSRWLNRFAEECREKLLSDREKATESHHFRWMTEAFLRGDTTKRFEAYAIAITNRILSPNEVRQKEDMNPYDGGDEFLNPNIEPSAPTNGSAQNAHVALLRERVGHLLKCEQNRIKHAAKSARNFVDWLDKFYDTEFASLSENILMASVTACQSCGIATAGIDKAVGPHGAESRHNLLEVAGHADKTTLPDYIGTLLDGWPDREHQFLARLMGSKNGSQA